MQSSATLATHRLQVGYGTEPIIREVSVTFPVGQFTAICGPNGCGKSTLLLALARVLPPCGGQVTLAGQDVRRVSTKALARQLTFLPQYPSAPGELTVRALVERGRDPYRTWLRPLSTTDQTAIDQAGAVTGVDHVWDRRLGELSGGQRQRAWLALTLAQDCAVLLLDEPISHLDLAYQVQVLQLCREQAAQGRTVVVVLHDLNLAAQFAHRVLLLHNGRAHATGPPAEVFSTDNLAAVFRVSASTHTGIGAAELLIVPTGTVLPGEHCA